jgi:hypothetical protein
VTGPQGCDGHEGVGEELRVLALTALDRIDPVLDRLCAEPGSAEPGSAEPGSAEPGSEAPGTCASCPVCAVIAALRGERPELVVRLAEHAAGLVSVLRAALDEGGTAPAAAHVADPPPARRVQRITVERRIS